MEAFVEDDDPMDYFQQHDHHHHQQQQPDHPKNELRVHISSSTTPQQDPPPPSFSLMKNGEVDVDDDEDDQEQQEKQQPRSLSDQNLSQQQQQQQRQHDHHAEQQLEQLNKSSDAIADQADSKEGSKDAGSWSTHATSVLLDVFREKRLAINGRNFRGEEWEELASSVNERCYAITPPNSSNLTTIATASNSSKELWKNAKQCSYKMSNLKRKYKSEKEMIQLTGSHSSGSGWQWFSKMEAIFGSDPKYTTFSSGISSGSELALHASKGDLIVDAVAGATDEEIFGANNKVVVINSTDKRILRNNSFDPGVLLPPSKSASTNNLDGSSPSTDPRRETAAESSPREFYTTTSKHSHSKKKLCVINSGQIPAAGVGGSPAAAAAAGGSMEGSFPASFSDSIKLLLMQQKEAINLLRELSYNRPPSSQQRHDPESSEFGARRDLLDLKSRIDAADMELVYLKQLCESKEKELKDAMQVYEDKNKYRNELVRKLMEGVYEKEISKMRRRQHDLP
ncbi:uncharacterized protein LOC9657866 isoform X1 [Selaginella moellendorffii]|uniref:uncharacterized protein LOC9657866 isoform X1 n=1 Tax=Selaginella moellendorffii TaxID=88036 RepID=UPI000D1CC50C|nr:uncharacterized protein LOC9657866 isoform X1 [Selaginella moellendorffii]|eukprot:XP_024542752.1 uncharacterized protein LOC9657866 isoform X1 [Selaginella moellendorffii]